MVLTACDLVPIGVVIWGGHPNEETEGDAEACDLSSTAFGGFTKIRFLRDDEAGVNACVILR